MVTNAAIERVLQERGKPGLLAFGVIEVDCRVTGLEETGAHWGEFWDGGLHTARNTLLWNCGNTDCTGEGPSTTEDSTVMGSSARANFPREVRRSWARTYDAARK